jgi:uncharacterized protein YhaN
MRILTKFKHITPDRSGFLRAALGDPQEARAALESHRKDLASLEDKVLRAREALEALRRDAPSTSLEAAKARHDRLKAAREQAEKRWQEITTALASLNGAIEALAGEGVEERLEEMKGRLEAARRKRDNLRHEVAVLQTLSAALEKARQDARDTYVAPVIRELGPLLDMVLPGGQIEMDADSISPVRLTRPGRDDSIAELSGGTREQLALLVRLAFARLLAKNGEAVPVILDDAIVYTDDDRIEKMFDALNRQARDLQIMILTCRQRAFQNLGGQLLRIIREEQGGG